MSWIWFGEPFNQLCEDEFKVPTPVGMPCEHCSEPIAEAESGAVLSRIKELPKIGPFHAATVKFDVYHCECLFRTFAGSSGHLLHQCGCYGLEDKSEDGLSLRAAALKCYATAMAMPASADDPESPSRMVH